MRNIINTLKNQYNIPDLEARKKIFEIAGELLYKAAHFDDAFKFLSDITKKIEEMQKEPDSVVQNSFPLMEAGSKFTIPKY